MTHAEQLIRAIRRKAMTYGELEDMKVSTCPWKRLSETGHRYLRKGEQIVRKTGRDGLVRIGIAKAPKGEPCYFDTMGEKHRKEVHGR
jgi:hypothetical protein